MITKVSLFWNTSSTAIAVPLPPLGKATVSLRFGNRLLRCCYFLKSKIKLRCKKLLLKAQHLLAFPSGGRGTATAVDEVFEKINFAQCGVIVGAAAKNLFLKPRWHHAAIAPKLATAAAKGESRHVLRARLRKKSPRERQPKQDVRRSVGKRKNFPRTA